MSTCGCSQATFLPAALGLLALVSLPGCYAQAAAGYTAPVAGSTDLRGGALRLHLGTNTSQTLFGSKTLRTGPQFGFGVNLTGRATRDNQQLGPGLEVLERLVLRSHDERGSGLDLMQLYGRGGVAMAQFGQRSRELAMSAFSPSLELGTVWRVGNEDIPFWTLSGFVERDVRIDARDLTFYGVLLGAGDLK